MKYITTFAIAMLATVGSAHANTLCGDSPCNIEIVFADGGTISTNSDTTFEFTLGGFLDLGEAGEIYLDAETLNSPPQEILNDTQIPLLSEFTLSNTGKITFGPNGKLNVIGNLTYAEGTIIEIQGATQISISSTESTPVIPIVDIANYNTIEFVVSENMLANSDKTPEGLSISADSESLRLDIDMPSVEMTGAIMSSGDLHITAGYTELPTIAAGGMLNIESAGKIIQSASLSGSAITLTSGTGGMQNLGSTGETIQPASLSGSAITLTAGAGVIETSELISSAGTATISSNTELPLPTGSLTVVETQNNTQEGGGALSIFFIIISLLIRRINFKSVNNYTGR